MWKSIEQVIEINIQSFRGTNKLDEEAKIKQVDHLVNILQSKYPAKSIDEIFLALDENMSIEDVTHDLENDIYKINIVLDYEIKPLKIRVFNKLQAKIPLLQRTKSYGNVVLKKNIKLKSAIHAVLAANALKKNIIKNGRKNGKGVIDSGFRVKRDSSDKGAKGSYSTVLKTQCIDKENCNDKYYCTPFTCDPSKKNVLLKIINKKKASRDLEKEILAMNTLGLNIHKNIKVALEYQQSACYYESEMKDCMVLENAGGKELFDIINSEENPYSKMKNGTLRIIGDLVSALQFMHSRNFYHRDIKPENIMMDFDASDMNVPTHANIIDFGLSTVSTTGYCKTRCGSPNYVSAELYFSDRSERGYDAGNNDKFSLAVTFFILCLKTPYFPFRNKEKTVHCISDKYKYYSNIWTYREIYPIAEFLVPPINSTKSTSTRWSEMCQKMRLFENQ